MRKLLNLTVCIILCIGIFSACGNPMNNVANENKIVSDVNNMNIEQFENEGIEITSCEIIKRQTNKEDKNDFVYVKLFSENSFRKLEYQYKLTYNFYDEGGWILDEISPENKNEWKLSYLDAEGKDILESMIWFENCDANEEEWRNSHYLGEVNGEHYIATEQYNEYDNSIYFKVYNTQGNFVFSRGYNEDTAPSMMTFQEVYANSKGELCYIVSCYPQGRHFSKYMTDTNGDRISDFYTDIIPFKSTPDTLCVYEDRKFGAISNDGSIVKNITYKKAEDVMPQWKPELKPAPEGFEFLESKNNATQTNSNGVFQSSDKYGHRVLTDVNSENIIKIPHIDALPYTQAGLVRVHENEEWRIGTHFKIYDLNGNCRSPEFIGLGNSSISTVVNYNGKLGVLPQILSNDEEYYFKYEWATDKE